MRFQFQKRSVLKLVNRIIPPQAEGISIPVAMRFQFQKRSVLKLVNRIIPPQAEGILIPVAMRFQATQVKHKETYMRRFSLFEISLLLGLFVGLISPAVSLAADNKTASSIAPAEYSTVFLKNQEYFPVLLKVIDEAKSEILMSFFLFKAGVHRKSYPDRVLAHLAKSIQRGVKVVVILENSGGHDHKLDGENNRTKQILEAKGAEVHFDSPAKTMHNKLIVVDRRLVLLGSHNLTQAALKYNNETSLLIDKPELAEAARTYLLTIIKESQ